MNYVPGTASLIDDIDSKIRAERSPGSVRVRVLPSEPFPFVTDLRRFCPAEKHLVLLRDGRTLIGYLRSIDQFGTGARLPLHPIMLEPAS